MSDNAGRCVVTVVVPAKADGTPRFQSETGPIQEAELPTEKRRCVLAAKHGGPHQIELPNGRQVDFNADQT